MKILRWVILFFLLVWGCLLLLGAGFVIGTLIDFVSRMLAP